MTSLEAERRNRGQAAFRAYAARMGHATDLWPLMSESEVEAWCAAADAALGYGFRPTPGFAGNTGCAGTVMMAAVSTSEEWKGTFAGAGAAGGAGVPFMVGGGGGGGAAGGVGAQTGVSGVFPIGSGAR